MALLWSAEAIARSKPVWRALFIPTNFANSGRNVWGTILTECWDQWATRPTIRFSTERSYWMVAEITFPPCRARTKPARQGWGTHQFGVCGGWATRRTAESTPFFSSSGAPRYSNCCDTRCIANLVSLRSKHAKIMRLTIAAPSRITRVSKIIRPKL